MALNIAMPSKYLTTQQVAAMLHTNASLIRKSRITGMLYDVPAPLFKRLGKSKILYLESEIHKFMEQVPDSRLIT